MVIIIFFISKKLEISYEMIEVINNLLKANFTNSKIYANFKYHFKLEL